MYITKLELENWRKIPRISLDLEAGINLIFGRNEIGKSSIIESIRMALLQDPSMKAKACKDMTTWGTDLPATVRLSFTARNSRHYQVMKSFPNGKGIFCLEANQLCGDAKKTQAHIFDILGLSEKTTPLFDLLFIEQGQALNIFEKKGNPLTEDTKAHISHVIKETAFKELHEFEQILKTAQDQILTSRGAFKTGRDAPECKKLLDEALVQKERLDELITRESEYRKILLEIEKLEEEIGTLDQSRTQKEHDLKQLQEKRVRLEEIERKRLQFEPVRKNYEQLLKIDHELEKTGEELSRLFLFRNSLISRLSQELVQCEAEQKQLAALIEKLKVKKAEIEKLNEKKRLFETIEREYRQVIEMRGELEKNSRLLPHLLFLNCRKLASELQEIEARLNQYQKKQEELKRLSERIKTYPEMKEEDIRKLKEMGKGVASLEQKIESHKSALKMRFKITPCGNKEIRFHIQKDQEESKPYTIDQPLEMTGFQSLSFQYPEAFDLRVSGSLAQVDLDALQVEFLKKREALDKQLCLLHCSTTEELEKKHLEWKDLKKDISTIQKQIETLENIPGLEGRKAEIAEQLKLIEGEMKKLPDIASPGKKGEIDPHFSDKPAQFLRDQLIKAKADRENWSLQIDQILKNRPFEILEKEYTEKKGEIQTLSEGIKKIEPIDIEAVTQKDLDHCAEKLTHLLRIIDQKKNDHHILTHMALESDAKPIPQKPGMKKEPSPQDLRDKIKENEARQSALLHQKKEILTGKSVAEYKKEYLLKKDEIDLLTQRLEEMPPEGLNQAKEIEGGIRKTSLAITSIRQERDEKANRKAELTGEMKNFGPVLEEKSRIAYEYGQIKERIKSELTAVAALKLLLRLMAEEKEKAQEKVFRPIQDRVIKSFCSLVPDTYQLEIDNQLNLGISARTGSGAYRQGIYPSLSYGTREQLSFLLRLAIVEQISKKEPQVMILDDSFVNTDHLRLPRIMDIIRERSKEIQFLIFTCKQDDYLRYKEDYHCIDLEGLL